MSSRCKGLSSRCFQCLRAFASIWCCCYYKVAWTRRKYRHTWRCGRRQVVCIWMNKERQQVTLFSDSRVGGCGVTRVQVGGEGERTMGFWGTGVRPLLPGQSRPPLGPWPCRVGYGSWYTAPWSPGLDHPWPLLHKITWTTDSRASSQT